MAKRTGGGKRNDRLNCPVHFALEIFGDRWTLLVIRDLMFMGKRHFHEFIESPERIASNVLAARLKKLERQGLISRHRDPDNRKQVIYELTEKGLDLLPTLLEVIRWSGKYDPDTAAPRNFLDRAATDRDGLMRDLTAAAKQRKPVVGGRS